MPSPAEERVHAALDSWARRLEPGSHRVLVAYSGGADSTALLAALLRLRSRHGWKVTAAHLDHALDPGSAERARRAAETARGLGVELVARRAQPPEVAAAGGLEAAARRSRYRFLDQVRDERRCDVVCTAHHCDDQAETVVLRLRAGSRLRGLRAITARVGPLHRPLLELEGDVLRTYCEVAGLSWIEDPTNQDLGRDRNLVRHQLLPLLYVRHGCTSGRLANLARRAAAARQRIDERVAAALEPSVDADRGEASFARDAMLELPAELRLWAICAMHEAVGEPHGAPRAARELARQLGAGSQVGCDLSGARSWRAVGDRIELSPRADGPAGSVDFSYTFALPGERVLPEAGFRLELSQSPVQPWMRRAWPTRVGLALPLSAGDTIEVRNRRPGDRLQPFGWSTSCRLKELLINRHVPKEQRDGLPLLIVDGEIAWVPGVTISDRFRIGADENVWRATLHPLPSPSASPPTTRNET